MDPKLRNSKKHSRIFIFVNLKFMKYPSENKKSQLNSVAVKSFLNKLFACDLKVALKEIQTLVLVMKVKRNREI